MGRVGSIKYWSILGSLLPAETDVLSPFLFLEACGVRQAEQTVRTIGELNGVLLDAFRAARESAVIFTLFRVLFRC